MKKCLFFVIFCVAMFSVGCSDPHKNLEDFPEIIPDEPEIVMPEDPIQDASSNSDEPSVEPEVEEFEFDVSKLTPSKYSDIIESDPTLLSLNPTVVKKDSFVDIIISFGNESLKKVDVVDGKEVNSSPLGDYKWELEVLIDDVWYNVMGDLEKFIPDEYSENLGLLFAVPTIEVYLDHVNTWTIPTGTVLSGLPVGRYRVVKDVDGWKYAEFVIE